MARIYKPVRRSWPQKLTIAAWSIVVGMRGQSSFYVHLFFVVAVVLAGLLLQVSLIEWSLLILSMTGVLVAEMINRALELLARAVTQYENRWVRDALDVASAAVMLAAIGAVLVGCLVLGPHLWGIVTSRT